MKTEFVIVTGKADDGAAEFRQAVKYYLERGFKFHGPPTFLVKGNPAYTLYVVGYQAMIYEETEESPI